MSMSALPLELIAHIGHWAGTPELLSMRFASKGVSAVITSTAFETVVFRNIPTSALLREDRFPDVLSHARRARLICRGDDPPVAIDTALRRLVVPCPHLQQAEIVLDYSEDDDREIQRLSYAHIVRMRMGPPVDDLPFDLVHYERSQPGRTVSIHHKVASVSISSTQITYLEIPSWIGANMSWVLGSISVSRCVVDSLSLYAVFALQTPASLTLDHVLLDSTSRLGGRPLVWMMLWSRVFVHWPHLTRLRVENCGYAKPVALRESYTPIAKADMNPLILQEDARALVILMDQIAARTTT